MKRCFAALVISALTVTTACSADGGPRPAASDTGPPRILVFTRTAGFKHSSIPAAAAALEAALQSKATVVTTDDPSAFTDDGLARFRAVVFLMTTGDVLNAEQQAAFERFVAGGGGYAGVHSATDTEYDWAWYHELVGATFKRHPRIQRGTLRISDSSHPSMRHLPSPWTRVEEWYDFRDNPRPRVHVLATVDESSYSGGSMGGDHPVVWCRAAGRVWYTAMGHAADSWADHLFVQHVAAGVLTAAGRETKACP